MKEDLRIFTSEDLEAARKYRKTSGIMTAIAVGLYIVSWLPLVICGVAAESAGANVELWGIVGLCFMMVIVAVATAIIIINSYMRPICLKDNKIVFVGNNDGGEDDGGESNDESKDRNPVQIGVDGAIWMIALAIFLCIGFVWGYWHPGWIVFIVAVAVNKISDVIFAVARNKKAEKKNRE